MRNVFFKLLTIILCIVLCVNFVRFFVASSSDDGSTVSVVLILDSLSKIGADPLYLYDDLSRLLSLNASFFTSFYDLFLSKTYNDASDVLSVIKNFFLFIYISFENGIAAIYQLAIVLVDVVRFLVAFFNSIVAFINTVLDVFISPASTSGSISGVGGIGSGAGGGGFGGRR